MIEHSLRKEGCWCSMTILSALEDESIIGGPLFAVGLLLKMEAKLDPVIVPEMEGAVKRTTRGKCPTLARRPR